MALALLKISPHNQIIFAEGGSGARHEDILDIFPGVAPTSNEEVLLHSIFKGGMAKSLAVMRPEHSQVMTCDPTEHRSAL